MTADDFAAKARRLLDHQLRTLTAAGDPDERSTRRLVASRVVPVLVGLSALVAGPDGAEALRAGVTVRWIEEVNR